MEPLVSSALMEQTWRTVATSSATAVRRMQKQCGKDQEELTGFVLGFTSDLRSEALGLVLYVHVVITQAFRETGAKFRKLSPLEIQHRWNDNGAFIDDLKASGHTCTPFVLPAELTSEPAAIQYIVDALTEEDATDPVGLTVDEFWHALRVLKTTVDCMHEAAEGGGDAT